VQSFREDTAYDRASPCARGRSYALAGPEGLRRLAGLSWIVVIVSRTRTSIRSTPRRIGSEGRSHVGDGFRCHANARTGAMGARASVARDSTGCRHESRRWAHVVGLHPSPLHDREPHARRGELQHHMQRVGPFGKISVREDAFAVRPRLAKRRRLLLEHHA
jgi:hypothetical protein